MRVLLSVGWLGGAGGAERNAHSIIRALAADDVDVVTRVRLSGHLSEVDKSIRVFTPLDWRWRYASMKGGLKGALAQRLVNPVRSCFLPRYDVYVQLRSGANLSGTVRADVRLLIPSGGQVDDEMARNFDFVALQAPDNGRFLPNTTPRKLLPPPVYPVSEGPLPPSSAIPERFYLTVFNPYDPFKGSSDLGRVAETAPYPIVWCHSEATTGDVMPPELRSHRNICHIDDPTPGELQYLYERCVAYLSFSQWEGFGWAIADALRYSRAVVSRPVGVLSYPESQKLPGVHLVGADWSTDWGALDEDQGHDVPRDLPWISPEQFRSTLSGYVSEAQPLD